MCGLAAPPHQPSPGGSATPPRLGVCPPPARLRAAPWSCRLPLKGGVMSISWERGRPARILSSPALPPPPVPPVKPAEVAVPDSLPQNAPSRPPSRVFLARGSQPGAPSGGVVGVVWEGQCVAGGVHLNRRLRGCGCARFPRPRAHARYVFSVVVKQEPCRRHQRAAARAAGSYSRGAEFTPLRLDCGLRPLADGRYRRPPQGGSDLEACTKLLARFLGMM